MLLNYTTNLEYIIKMKYFKEFFDSLIFIDKYVKYRYTKMQIKEGKNMNLIKILRGGQITMPKKVRDIFGIKEGDVFELLLEKDGILLKPKKIIDKESVLSIKGEKLVANALDEFNRGETVGSFSDINDALNALKNTEV